MYGAILGDIIGAPYEFDRGNKTKEFPLFVRRSHYTDDSVMTIAVAEAILETKDKTPEEIKAAVIRSMQKWGRKYPDAGYGRKFYWWLKDKDPKPYGSWGNGSAMRVSSVGWLFDTLEKTREAARLTAEVTHDHPEGIKGAEAIASAIFMARNGCTKDKIKDYIIREFGYDLSRTCDEIRPGYHHVESCQMTVPEAITAFLEGNDFEDVIRTAVSLGGDCDTLTCIAGGIAEAFYGVPEEMKKECRERLPKDMLVVLDRFAEMVKRAEEYHDPFLEGNEQIEKAIQAFQATGSKEDRDKVLKSILDCMHENAHVLIPVEVNEDNTQFAFRTVKFQNGDVLHVFFTTQEEFRKGAESRTLSNFMDTTLKAFLDNGNDIMINPWGCQFLLTVDDLKMLFRMDEEWKEKIRSFLEDGSLLKGKVLHFRETRSERSFLNIFPVLQESFVFVPCTAVPGEKDQKILEEMVSRYENDPEVLRQETFTSQEPIRLIPDILQRDGEFFFPVFTSEDEMGEYGDGFSHISQRMQDVVRVAENNERNVSGIVINAFTDQLVVPREMFPQIINVGAEKTDS